MHAIGVTGMKLKTEIEIEKLLHWAYQDELSKLLTSSAEGIWDYIREYGQRGGIDHDPGPGSAQRYSHFGLPHPDAQEIEKAVSALEDCAIDWAVESLTIMGDLLALADTRPLAARPSPMRKTIIGWWEGSKWFKRSVAAPRDVIIVRSLKTAALVTMHAKLGKRPDWHSEPTRPYRIMAAKGGKPAIVGECWGKNAYAPGSYCPLVWDPTPISIAESRADYLAWWRGLDHLAKTLRLAGHTVLPPAAPEMPWLAPEAPRAKPVIHKSGVVTRTVLPLNPRRRDAIGCS